MDFHDSLIDLIGNTPLLRLSRVERGLDCTLLAKVEVMNPGGSVKDRIGIRMIEAAERSGKLKPGGTIVEPTSGNTGVGLAIAAAIKGYKCIFIMPDKMSQEKISLLRAYGAEVVIAPTAVAPDSPESYYRVADRLTAQIPGAFQPNQYFNDDNPRTHYETTGPEIWAQTEGKITHFVAGVGTGGTISGTGRYLKEQNPDIVVVGGDPEGSIYTGSEPRPYLVEGIGEDFWPDTFDKSIVDRWVTVSDRDSFVMARRVTRREGLLVGGSGGTAMCAALEVARVGARRRGGRDNPRLRAWISVEGLQRCVDAPERLHRPPRNSGEDRRDTHGEAPARARHPGSGRGRKSRERGAGNRHPAVLRDLADTRSRRARLPTTSSRSLDRSTSAASWTGSSVTATRSTVRYSR